MFISSIHNILKSEELARVHQLIQNSDFIDGRISGGNASDKKNLELVPESEKYLEVRNIVESATRENIDFNLTAFPRYITNPIISRYEMGMYYHDHVDLPVMGFMGSPRRVGRSLPPLGSNYVRSDLSMTLFLSDPDTYVGGELTFQGPFEPVSSKLPAGSGILYPTGTRHSVARVTKGVRYAAIFWIQTLFPVEAHRQAVCHARQLMTALGAKAPDSDEFQLAQDSFYNLCRIFAEV